MNVNYKLVKVICGYKKAREVEGIYPSALLALLAAKAHLCRLCFYGPYLAITNKDQTEAAKMEGVVASVGSIYSAKDEVILCQLTPDVVKEDSEGSYLIRHDIEGNCGVARARYN